MGTLGLAGCPSSSDSEDGDGSTVGSTSMNGMTNPTNTAASLDSGSGGSDSASGGMTGPTMSGTGEPDSSTDAGETSGPVMLADGAYSVIRYSLDGGDLTDINDTNRRDAFMVRLDSSTGVLQLAACIEPGASTPADSPCLVSPSTTEWSCQCFGFAATESEIAMVEFDPGDSPPTAEVGTGQFEAQLGNAPMGFSMSPLPDGLWGSDGASSVYVFEARADSIFERAFDDPDRPSCDPC